MNIEGLRDGSKRASVTQTVDALKELRSLCEKDLRSVADVRPRNRLCNIREQADAVVEANSAFAGHSRIKLLVDCDSRASALIDPVQLRRCLSNLLNNSLRQLSGIKREGKVVKIVVTESERETYIDVQDNGQESSRSVSPVYLSPV